MLIATFYTSNTINKNTHLLYLNNLITDLYSLIIFFKYLYNINDDE
jgi:hypothetical protein